MVKRSESTVVNMLFQAFVPARNVGMFIAELHGTIGGRSTQFGDVATDYAEQLADIDVRMEKLQLKLVNLNTKKLESEDLSRDVNALREEKARIMVEIAENKGRQLKKEEMIRFLQEQTVELDAFDDGLVRRLVEQVVVHRDGNFTVEFKSCTSLYVRI